MTAVQRRETVDELIAEGRLLDAIAALTDLARKSRDPDIEERLVLLRRDAFHELDGVLGREPWPPVVDDPMPGYEGLVEVEANELTPDLLAGGIQHHGSILVRGLIDDASASRLRQDIDRAFEGLEAYRRGVPVTETRPWFVPVPLHSDRPARFVDLRRKIGDGAKVVPADSPGTMFDVIEMLEACGWRDLIQQYFGTRPVLTENKWSLFRYPYRKTLSGWHQEVSVFPPKPLRTVNLWLALSPCGEHAPGLKVFPKRVNAVIPTKHNYFPDPAALAKHLETGTPVVPLFEPGDALLFDEMTIHGSHFVEGMSETRYSMETWFFAPGACPEELGVVVF